jgi:hypothetical protein
MLNTTSLTLFMKLTCQPTATTTHVKTAELFQRGIEFYHPLSHPQVTLLDRGLNKLKKNRERERKAAKFRVGRQKRSSGEWFLPTPLHINKY